VTVTLLIAYTDVDFQVIAADRRLTPFDTAAKPTDDLYKVASFDNGAMGYHFAVAYTGYATDGADFDMLGWLVAALPVCFAPSTDFGAGHTALAVACSKRFARLGREARRVVTRVQLCGTISFSDGTRPFIAYVSNRNNAEVGSTFKTGISLGRRKDSYLYHIMPPAGESSRTVRDLKRSIRVLRKLGSYQAKVGTLVALIQKTHNGNKMGTVGPDVLAAWFEQNVNDPTTFKHCGGEWAVNNPQGYGLMPPQINAAGATIIDVTVTNGLVPQNDPRLPNLRSRVPKKSDI
jgi:hypothetical protein